MVDAADTERFLAVAEETLRTDGAHAMSLRKIAERAGTSTQTVYTRFGGKAGLADALYRRGFELLALSLESAELSDDPIEQIIELSRAYRMVAHGQPQHYMLMTERPIADYVPPPESLRFAASTMKPLVTAVGQAIASGRITGDATVISECLWAAGHGHITLEIHGFIETNDRAFEELCRRLIDGYRT